MARVNISLPDDLYRRVKAEGVPVSQVCQDALRRELDDRRDAKLDKLTQLWESDPTRRQ